MSSKRYRLSIMIPTQGEMQLLSIDTYSTAYSTAYSTTGLGVRSPLDARERNAAREGADLVGVESQQWCVMRRKQW